MTTNHDSNHLSNQKKKKSIWKTFFRLLLIILIGVAVAILLYIGFTQYYRQLIDTIDSNHESIKDIENRLGQLEIQADDRLPEYNRRLSVLESDKSLDAEKISEIEADIVSAEKLLDEHASQLEQQEKVIESIDELSTSVASILTQTPAATTTVQQPEVITLSHNVKMLRAAELLNRSRIYLLQHNYGLAIQDIEKARMVLINLQAEAGQNETLIISMQIDMLGKALELLPDYPFQASNEIEAAWEMLVVGLTENSYSIPMSFSYGTPTLTQTPMPASNIDDEVSSDSENSTTTPTPEETRKTGMTPTR